MMSYDPALKDLASRICSKLQWNPDVVSELFPGIPRWEGIAHMIANSRAMSPPAVTAADLTEAMIHAAATPCRPLPEEWAHQSAQRIWQVAHGFGVLDTSEAFKNFLELRKSGEI